ncbi:Putative fucose permease [Elusimicrobium minutum Pei191]|uniref:Putative fucose permease n=1 Tax=Elusimicrobium minutum (strain Pei191) TaxID=445932 RepID=B2KCC3_ELUMP|nr:MFS transporter [Elusimicrobium minutum]ACC98044.1 Putative fucose permease [Elusimicrobium minutum Pei191]
MKITETVTKIISAVLIASILQSVVPAEVYAQVRVEKKATNISTKNPIINSKNIKNSGYMIKSEKGLIGREISEELGKVWGKSFAVESVRVERVYEEERVKIAIESGSRERRVYEVMGEDYYKALEYFAEQGGVRLGYGNDVEGESVEEGGLLNSADRVYSAYKRTLQNSDSRKVGKGVIELRYDLIRKDSRKKLEMDIDEATGAMLKVLVDILLYSKRGIQERYAPLVTEVLVGMRRLDLGGKTAGSMRAYYKEVLDVKKSKGVCESRITDGYVRGLGEAQKSCIDITSAMTGLGLIGGGEEEIYKFGKEYWSEGRVSSVIMSRAAHGLILSGEKGIVLLGELIRETVRSGYPRNAVKWAWDKFGAVFTPSEYVDGYYNHVSKKALYLNEVTRRFEYIDEEKAREWGFSVRDIKMCQEVEVKRGSDACLMMPMRNVFTDIGEDLAYLGGAGGKREIRKLLREERNLHWPFIVGVLGSGAYEGDGGANEIRKVIAGTTYMDVTSGTDRKIKEAVGLKIGGFNADQLKRAREYYNEKRLAYVLDIVVMIALIGNLAKSMSTFRVPRSVENCWRSLRGAGNAGKEVSVRGVRSVKVAEQAAAMERVNAVKKVSGGVKGGVIEFGLEGVGGELKVVKGRIGGKLKISPVLEGTLKVETKVKDLGLSVGGSGGGGTFSARPVVGKGIIEGGKGISLESKVTGAFRVMEGNKVAGGVVEGEKVIVAARGTGSGVGRIGRVMGRAKNSFVHAKNKAVVYSMMVMLPMGSMTEAGSAVKNISNVGKQISVMAEAGGVGVRTIEGGKLIRGVIAAGEVSKAMRSAEVVSGVSKGLDRAGRIGKASKLGGIGAKRVGDTAKLFGIGSIIGRPAEAEGGSGPSSGTLERVYAQLVGVRAPVSKEVSTKEFIKQELINMSGIGFVAMLAEELKIGREIRREYGKEGITAESMKKQWAAVEMTRAEAVLDRAVEEGRELTDLENSAVAGYISNIHVNNQGYVEGEKGEWSLSNTPIAKAADDYIKNKYGYEYKQDVESYKRVNGEGKEETVSRIINKRVEKITPAQEALEGTAAHHVTGQVYSSARPVVTGVLEHTLGSASEAAVNAKASAAEFGMQVRPIVKNQSVSTIAASFFGVLPEKLKAVLTNTLTSDEAESLQNALDSAYNKAILEFIVKHGDSAAAKVGDKTVRTYPAFQIILENNINNAFKTVNINRTSLEAIRAELGSVIFINDAELAALDKADVFDSEQRKINTQAAQKAFEQKQADGSVVNITEDGFEILNPATDKVEYTKGFLGIGKKPKISVNSSTKDNQPLSIENKIEQKYQVNAAIEKPDGSIKISELHSIKIKVIASVKDIIKFKQHIYGNYVPFINNEGNLIFLNTKTGKKDSSISVHATNGVSFQSIAEKIENGVASTSLPVVETSMRHSNSWTLALYLTSIINGFIILFSGSNVIQFADKMDLSNTQQALFSSVTFILAIPVPYLATIAKAKLGKAKTLKLGVSAVLLGGVMSAAFGLGHFSVWENVGLQYAGLLASAFITGIGVFTTTVTTSPIMSNITGDPDLRMKKTARLQMLMSLGVMLATTSAWMLSKAGIDPTSAIPLLAIGMSGATLAALHKTNIPNFKYNGFTKNAEETVVKEKVSFSEKKIKAATAFKNFVNAHKTALGNFTHGNFKQGADSLKYGWNIIFNDGEAWKLIPSAFLLNGAEVGFMVSMPIMILAIMPGANELVSGLAFLYSSAPFILGRLTAKTLINKFGMFGSKMLATGLTVVGVTSAIGMGMSAGVVPLVAAIGVGEYGISSFFALFNIGLAATPKREAKLVHWISISTLGCAIFPAMFAAMADTAKIRYMAQGLSEQLANVEATTTFYLMAPLALIGVSFALMAAQKGAAKELINGFVKIAKNLHAALFATTPKAFASEKERTQHESSRVKFFSKNKKDDTSKGSGTLNFGVNPTELAKGIKKIFTVNSQVVEGNGKVIIQERNFTLDLPIQEGEEFSYKNYQERVAVPFTISHANESDVINFYKFLMNHKAYVTKDGEIAYENRVSKTLKSHYVLNSGKPLNIMQKIQDIKEGKNITPINIDKINPSSQFLSPLYLTSALMAMEFAVSPLITNIQETLGYSDGKITVLVATTTLAAIFLPFFSSPFAGKFGRKTALNVGLSGILIGSLASYLFGFGNIATPSVFGPALQFAGILLSIFAIGVGKDFINNSAAPMMSSITTEERVRTRKSINIQKSMGVGITVMYAAPILFAQYFGDATGSIPFIGVPAALAGLIWLNLSGIPNTKSQLDTEKKVSLKQELAAKWNYFKNDIASRKIVGGLTLLNMVEAGSAIVGPLIFGRLYSETTAQMFAVLTYPLPFLAGRFLADKIINRFGVAGATGFGLVSITAGSVASIAVTHAAPLLLVASFAVVEFGISLVFTVTYGALSKNREREIMTLPFVIVSVAGFSVGSILWGGVSDFTKYAAESIFALSPTDALNLGSFVGFILLPPVLMLPVFKLFNRKGMFKKNEKSVPIQAAASLPEVEQKAAPSLSFFGKIFAAIKKFFSPKDIIDNSSFSIGLTNNKKELLEELKSFYNVKEEEDVWQNINNDFFIQFPQYNSDKYIFRGLFFEDKKYFSEIKENGMDINYVRPKTYPVSVDMMHMHRGEETSGMCFGEEPSGAASYAFGANMWKRGGKGYVAMIVVKKPQDIVNSGGTLLSRRSIGAEEIEEVLIFDIKNKKWVPVESLTEIGEPLSFARQENIFGFALEYLTV